MSNTVISVENVSKVYRLGQIGTGTLSYDLKIWWAKVRGKPNPLLKIGEKDHGNRDGETLFALRDVGFKVERGEILGIIGRNGAGKSTLLKIISRVTAPTSGKIKVKGRIASLLEVGTGFHPDLTGRENVYLNGAIMGMTREEVRGKLDEIVDFSGVEQFIDTPVKRYSSGMYVRLAFAVAAHLDPEILVLDEVLAVGDLAFQKKCFSKMDAVSKDGRTILFVSHNLSAVRKLCSRGIQLAAGRVSMEGSIDEIVAAYEKINQKGWELRETLAPGSLIKIEELSLMNSQGELTNKFFPGEYFTVHYRIMNSGALPQRVALGVSIEDSLPQRLFASYSMSESVQFELTPGLNDIEYRVPILPLNTGNYFVSVAVHHADTGRYFHRIDQASTFAVQEICAQDLDLYVPTSLGPVLARHEWVSLGKQ